MPYELNRNYDTDLSRSDVRTILANMAHELAEVKGIDLPTKTVFEEPDIIDEDANKFSVPVRPTVTDARISPGEIVPGECIRNGIYVRVHGMVIDDSDGGRNTVRVTVREEKPGDSRRTPTFDKLKEIWENR